MKNQLVTTRKKSERRGTRKRGASLGSVRASGAAGCPRNDAQQSKPHRPRCKRGASLRANSAATQRLYAEAEITTAGRSRQRSVLAAAAAHLDDVELESAWQAALRGDYVVSAQRLQRTVKQTRVHRRVRKHGDTPWRQAILSRRAR